MSALQPGALVVVASEGPGRVVSASGATAQVLLLSSRKVVTPAPERLRPVLEAGRAEALLERLAQPVSLTNAPPAVKEAMSLVETSLDAEALAEAFRALVATGSVEPEVETAKLYLEAMFGAELAAVLKLNRSVVASRIVREPQRPDSGSPSWLEALIKAGAVPEEAKPLDDPMRPIPISKAKAWTSWRLAFDALERFRMYPLIVEARFLGREPNEDLAKLGRRLRPDVLSRGAWPETVQFSLEEPMLVVAPHRAPWLTAAWLRFGGVNGCPPPEENARVLRKLHDEWSAFPIVYDELSLELVVRDPPKTPADVRRAMKAQLSWSEDTALASRASLERATRSAHWTLWWD
ncbi:MAG: DUF4253 domain-containing protein [Myxococcaceae bacterium]|nr:DUF4253 domain-containing protein [Myxococcaceae bacterium]